jgi:Peptide-N-glycosidase F, C terminal/Secretion system C-terminal sorting domain
MKKSFLLVLLALSFGFASKALPGDTIWVQANICNLTYYGNYDTVINFPSPGTTYRKVYMIFTLGKYVCPAGSTYCGDWDYTVTNYLMTPAGDTMEIARLITPYANAGAPRTPFTWKQPYVFDVTDYANIMHDSAAIRINYSGYSGGFTANIRFAFIEGTPDRTVLGVKKLWSGYWAYGDTTHHDSNNINTHFVPTMDTAPSSAAYGALKFTVTGHGSDANYCNEFCSHNYYVYLNGGKVDSYTVWRDNCGLNELYPQSGTWLYNRANWCPGAQIAPNYHFLPGVTGGSFSDVGLAFDPYISNGGAGYGCEGQLVYYGPFNKTLDASMDQIVAPTSDPNHFRENPICGNPTVVVKNTGSTTIDSVLIQYGFTSSSSPMFYTWYGPLASEQSATVQLPQLPQLDSVGGLHDTTYFTAAIVNVNGVPDNDRSNDSMRSQFISGPKWPNKFKVVFQTNNESIASGSSISETSWFIFDESNTILYSRALVNISTLYLDTIELGPGCYRFVVTDSSCDGLQWWADPSTITAGSLMVRTMANVAITMNGYSYYGTYNNDFGCGFTQQFTVADYPTGVAKTVDESVWFESYPNPAKGYVNLDLHGLNQVAGNAVFTDVLGRVAMTVRCDAGHTVADISKLTPGVYTISYTADNAPDSKLTTRLLIQK